MTGEIFHTAVVNNLHFAKISHSDASIKSLTVAPSNESQLIPAPVIDFLQDEEDIFKFCI